MENEILLQHIYSGTVKYFEDWKADSEYNNLDLTSLSESDLLPVIKYKDAWYSTLSLKNLMKELELEIKISEKEIEGLQNELDNYETNSDESTHEDKFCESLDGDGPVDVCGMKFDASHILQEMDPIAYNCGLSEYIDSLDVSEEQEYKEIEEEIDIKQKSIEETKDKIEEIISMKDQIQEYMEDLNIKE